MGLALLTPNGDPATLRPASGRPRASTGRAWGERGRRLGLRAGRPEVVAHRTKRPPGAGSAGSPRALRGDPGRARAVSKRDPRRPATDLSPVSHGLLRRAAVREAEERRRVPGEHGARGGPRRRLRSERRVAQQPRDGAARADERLGGERPDALRRRELL